MFPELSSIKTRRQILGIKQKDLAIKAKVSQSMIAKLESGKLEPSYTIVKRIFSILENLEHKKEKTCLEIMSKNMICLKKTDSIELASNAMRKHSISQIPIIENKRVIGSINESLILEKIIQGIDKKELFRKQIQEIMKEPFPILNSNTPLTLALPLLKTSEAILICEKDKISGIITKSNIL